MHPDGRNIVAARGAVTLMGSRKHLLPKRGKVK